MMRLLVADDVEAIRWLLNEVMSRDGWSVTAAGDGRAALAAARRLMPHVVLLDLGLPGPSSADIVRDLRALAPPPIIVVVTGHDNPEEALGAALGDIRAVVRKPFDLYALRDLLRGFGAGASAEIGGQGF